MEVSTITLLKESVYEEDEDSRLGKSTKAISQITALLPFQKQTRLLITEREFLKYLFLNLPITKGKSITMIIETLSYNFYQEEIFQKNFCSAVEYIAKIKDFLKQKSNNIDATPREKHYRASLLRQDFCLAISNNKIFLKLAILKQFKQFVDFLLINGEKNKIDPELRKEIIDILKEFLRNTFHEQIITNVSHFLEYLRGIWKENWLNGKLDFEIEDIIISKTNSFIKKKNHDIILIDESIVKNDSFHEENGNSSRNSLDNSENDSQKNPKNKIPKEEDEDEDQNLRTYDNLIEIEEWLIAEKEIPNITKNNYISDFFKIQGNLEFFLKFLLEPFYLKLNKNWVNEYPFLGETINSDHFKIFKTNDIFKNNYLIKKKIPSRFNSFIFRSFKVHEILTDYRNFRFIYSVNPKTIDIFCNSVSLAMKSENFLCEMNHLAQIIEVFLKRDPDAMLNGLFQYNILKYFLFYISFPKVHSLMISLLNVSGPKPLLNEVNQLKLLKNLVNNDYFLQISEFIIHGKWNLKIAPYNSGANPEKTAHTDITQIKNEINTEYLVLFEELTGFATDIDRIKDVVLKKKKLNLLKNTSKKIISLQKMKIPFQQKEEPLKIQKRKTMMIEKNRGSMDLHNLDESHKMKLPLLKQEVPQQSTPPIIYEQFFIRKNSELKYLDWEKFNLLYPSSSSLLRESSLDKLSKDPAYLISKLENKEKESELLMELLSFLIRNCLENYNNEKIGRLIGLPKKNFDLIMVGLFKNKSEFFNNLFKSFLLKAKLILVNPNTHAIIIGQTINLILKNYQNTWFSGARNTISSTIRKHFIFLQKTIINSFIWQLSQKFTIIRVLLIEQLYYIIKSEENFVLEETLEGLWDTLIHFFLKYRTQTIFLHYFVSIIKLIIKIKNQRALMIVFLKLNLLNIMNEEISKVMKNEVLSTQEQIEEFFCVCKSIVQSLEEAFLDVNFPLKAEITALHSWKILKTKYGKDIKSNKIINTVESLKSEQKIQTNNKKVSIFDPYLIQKNKVSFSSKMQSSSIIPDSPTKSKTSSSIHQNFGSLGKSSTHVFLTSPKMKTPPIFSSRLDSLNSIGENKRTVSNHNKSKTLLMGNRKTNKY